VLNSTGQHINERRRAACNTDLAKVAGSVLRMTVLW